MLFFKKFLLISVLSLFTAASFAIAGSGCCNKMGGVNYCDSSVGRIICNNGFYSACYCTRHAIMDLQLLKGCCLWHGGVLPTYDSTGLVVCNDGAVSEECSFQTPTDRISSW